jgi:hypothetical protein
MGQPPEGILRRLHRVHLRLSGNLDRAEPLPPPAGLQARLLPAADFVMAILYSRSRAGSVRSVRVTLATICLAAVVFVLAGALAVTLALAGMAGFNLLLLLAALVAASVSMAALLLATYGGLQRRAIRTAAAPRSPRRPPGPRAS